MNGPTALLARHAAGRPDDWDAAARHGAVRAVVDTLACIAAGRTDDAARRVAATLAPWRARGRSIEAVGGTRTAAPWAALVNGTAAHALDYDDVLEPAAAHASAVLVPALLALGEERRLPGARLVDALLLGFDVLAALARGVNMGHYARGWHTSVTLGAPAAAAACGRLIGLDAARMAHAISAATSFAAGSKRQFGTAMKPVHTGLAAQAGILAAGFAEQGIGAAAEMLEGPWSFPALYGAEGMAGFDHLADWLAGPPAMTAYGAWLKAYPCCASAHRPIDAVFALRRAHGFAAEAVRAVHARVSEVVMRNLMYEAPTDEMQARFSLNHCVALALRQAEIGVADFSLAAIARPELRGLWPLISMSLDPALPGTISAEPGQERAQVTITLADGRELAETVVYPRGHARAPLDDAALARKMEDCARATLSADSAAALATAAWSVDRRRGAMRMMDAFRHG
jgi:2-methylcitrate dehydratase PrpD